jgi:hypothetical protein
MGKNGSAAKVRGGAKPQDLPSPDAVGAAANSTTISDQGAAAGQAIDTATSANSSETTSQDQAGQQISGGAAASEMDTESALQVLQPATGGMVTGMRFVGHEGAELDLSKGMFPAKHVQIDLSVLKANLASLLAAPGPAADESSLDPAFATTGDGQSSAAAPASQSTHGLKVTSKQPGFRRAGRAWSTTATVIALSELTVDQVELLKAEPMLSVKAVVLEDEHA